MYDVDDVRELGEFRDEIRQQVLLPGEESFVEDHLWVVRVERQVVDGGLHQILEEMRPEGGFRTVAIVFTGNLDQHAGVVDVGVGGIDAQLDVAAAAPAAGAHQDKAAPWQDLIQSANGTPDRHEFLVMFQFGVLLRINVHNVGSVRETAIWDVTIGREDHFFRRQAPGYGCRG